MIIAAVDDARGIIAVGQGPEIYEAAKDLMSKFAEYQVATMEALNAYGIVRCVSKGEMS